MCYDLFCYLFLIKKKIKKYMKQFYELVIKQIVYYLELY